MKRAIAAMILGFATPAAASDLTLDIASRGMGGSIAVAVYRDAASFRRGEGPVASRIVPRTGPVTAVVLTGLTPGRYAVAAFHDTDGNGDLTLWPIGLPREAYGFSNNARGRFGPPPFEAAAIDLPAAGARSALALRRTANTANTTGSSRPSGASGLLADRPKTGRREPHHVIAGRFQIAGPAAPVG
jgi:uncharacterized protein (DUF2141 family)